MVFNLKTKQTTNSARVLAVAVLGLAGFTLLSGTIMASSMVSAEDNTSVVDQINITVPISCTMSGTGMNTHNAEIVNGTYTADIGTTTMHALCNDNNGFAIYAAGYTGNEIGGTNSNKLVGTSASSNATIESGLATTAGSPDVSNWAMKLAMTQDSGDTTGTNAFTIDSAPNTSGGADASFSSYHVVPNEYTKVAHKDSNTDMDATTGGVKLTTTYAAYISKIQAADTYSGQVIYTLVHPAGKHPLRYDCEPGKICYAPNGDDVVGTMGEQDATDGVTINLLPSNFSREGYGFAGWSDTYDYATNPNAHLYGPQETITVPEGTTANGLSLYAVWVKSVGSLQDSAKVAELCGTGGTLDQAPVPGSDTATLSSVSALTDSRDNDTYAIAKLADGNCWMIENLRLADTHQEGGNTVATTLTTTNTNNPLNDGDLTNPTVTLKHNYTDTDTYNTLSASSNVAYNANTAPDGWCNTNSAACDDQSRLRTDNTVSRASNPTSANNTNIYSYGNYYNWYSATAGNGTYAKSSGNTAGDLCPTGWHLPTGNTNGEFYTLNTRANSDSTSSDAGLRLFPTNFVYSGNVGGASVGNRGSSGLYWSSTAGNNISAYSLGFGSTSVLPGTGNVRKYYGGAIRCIVPSGS